MRSAPPSRLSLLAAPLPPLVLALGAPVLLSTGGVFHDWSGLDLHYFGLPLLLAGALWFSCRLVYWAGRTRLAGQLVLQTEAGGRPVRIVILPVVESLLAGSAWIALVWGALASVSRLPDTISDHPSGPDLGSVEPYLMAFDSLAIWAVFFLAPFVMARSFAIAPGGSQHRWPSHGTLGPAGRRFCAVLGRGDIVRRVPDGPV